MMLVAGPPSVAPAVAAGPCEVVCSDVSLDEPGACGFENDGGCSFFPAQVVPADPGDVFCGRAWADGGFRDTDWYLLCVEDPDGDGVAQVCGTLISEFPGAWLASACVPAPGDYVVFVAPGHCDGSGIFDDYPCDTSNDYQLCITVTNACDEPCGDCPTGAACPADLDGDGSVGIVDFLWLLAQWGTDPGGPPDFDGDGTVGVSDFLVLLASWGPCP
ncbi:MAG: hypothetical protein ACYSU2_18070 [Planctomycetota bacterium]